MTARTLLAVTCSSLVIGATAPAALADTSGSLYGGAVVGDDTGVGGAIGARIGWRQAGSGPRWGGFADASTLRFAGFGPHTGTRANHAMFAVERTLTNGDILPHVFAGPAVGQWHRDSEHDERIDATTLGLGLGAGLTYLRVRVELVATIPIYASTPMEAGAVGPQLSLALGVLVW